MDEKTAELRDIFIDVAEDGTVTESQDDERWASADTDDETIDDRVEAVIERMRDRYDFRTDLSISDLQAVVRRFYDGDDDDAVADALGIDPDTVFEARMDLHLLDDDEAAFPFDLDAVRTAEVDDTSPETLAAALDTDPSTVARAHRVVETQAAVRRVSGRFQSEFEDAIPDAALAVELTAAAQEDGLQELAEDIETNTKF